MAQDTLYFPHDYDPLRDPELRMLIKKRGAIGYGIFWRLIEILHQNSDHVLKFDPMVYELISDELKVSPEEVESVIEDCINGCDLLGGDGIVFWSDRVFKNIEKRKDISKKRSKAGTESAKARQKLKEIAESHSELSE